LVALHAALDPNVPRVELGFSPRRVWIGDASFPLKPGSNLAWLQERLDRADLSGVSFSGDADEASVVAFTQHLLDLFTRRNLELDFTTLWKDSYRGITPLERRFEGAFSEHGEPEQAPGHQRPSTAGRARHKEKSLHNALTLDPRVRSKVEEVQAGIRARAAHESEIVHVDLLDEIVCLLPAEGLHDYERAVDLCLGMLSAVVQALSNAGALPARGEHERYLRKLLLSVARSHFSSFAPELRGGRSGGEGVREPAAVFAPPASSRGDANGAAVADGARPQLHPEGHDRNAALDADAAISDDLGALLQEIELLCPAPTGQLRGADCEDPLEELGAFLHFISLHDDTTRFPGLRNGLKQLLDEATEAGLDVLRAYFATAPGAEAAGRLPARRVATWLRRNGLRRVVRTSGVLDEAWAVREFPEDFLDYLQTLDLANAKDRTELDRVCAAIGPRRFGVAADLLSEAQEFLAGPLPGRLFGLAFVSLAPFLRQVYEHDKRRYRGDFARYLGATLATGIDQAILGLVGDGPGLLTPYLNALADQDTQRLPEQRLLVVRAYLALVEGDPASEVHFLRAVKLLANFDAPATRLYLKRLIGERKMVLFKRHPRAVREAARDVLGSFGKEAKTRV
jgi:hypothetical protein